MQEAPFFAKERVIAYPIPREAPVTSAVLPESIGAVVLTSGDHTRFHVNFFKGTITVMSAGEHSFQTYLSGRDVRSNPWMLSGQADAIAAPLFSRPDDPNKLLLILSLQKLVSDEEGY
jgi:hypothetical protein